MKSTRFTCPSAWPLLVSDQPMAQLVRSTTAAIDHPRRRLNPPNAVPTPSQPASGEPSQSSLKRLFQIEIP